MKYTTLSARKLTDANWSLMSCGVRYRAASTSAIQFSIHGRASAWSSTNSSSLSRATIRICDFLAYHEGIVPLMFPVWELRPVPDIGNGAGWQSRFRVSIPSFSCRSSRRGPSFTATGVAIERKIAHWRLCCRLRWGGATRAGGRRLPTYCNRFTPWRAAPRARHHARALRKNDGKGRNLEVVFLTALEGRSRSS